MKQSPMETSDPKMVPRKRDESSISMTSQKSKIKQKKTQVVKVNWKEKRDRMDLYHMQQKFKYVPNFHVIFV